MGCSVLVQMFSLFQSLLQIGYGLTDFMDWSERTGTFLYLTQHKDLKEKKKRREKKKQGSGLPCVGQLTCYHLPFSRWWLLLWIDRRLRNHHLYFQANIQLGPISAQPLLFLESVIFRTLTSLSDLIEIRWQIQKLLHSEQSERWTHRWISKARQKYLSSWIYTNQSLIKVSHESHLDENPDLCFHDLIISSSDFLPKKYKHYSKSIEAQPNFLSRNQKSSGAGFPSSE